MRLPARLADQLLPLQVDWCQFEGWACWCFRVNLIIFLPKKTQFDPELYFHEIERLFSSPLKKCQFTQITAKSINTSIHSLTHTVHISLSTKIHDFQFYLLRFWDLHSSLRCQRGSIVSSNTKHKSQMLACVRAIERTQNEPEFSKITDLAQQ